MYTLQQAFDKMLNEMRARNYEVAYDEGNKTCTYCDPETGLKCHIGLLLTDEELEELGDDNNSASEIVYEYSFKSLDGLNGRVLDILQHIHDSSRHFNYCRLSINPPDARMKFYEQNMSEFAGLHNLNYTGPSTN